MIEETRVCDECGKDIPGTVHICPECGAGRPRTRRDKEARKRQFEPPNSQVGALTDAIRDVPRVPQEHRSGAHVKRKHRYPEAAPPDAALIEAQRRGTRHRSRHSRPMEVVTTEVRPDADTGGESGVVVKKVARRKIYRYGETRKSKFAFSTELRAIIGVIVLGVVLLVMCRVAFVEGAELGTAKGGVGGRESGVGAAEAAVTDASDGRSHTSAADAHTSKAGQAAGLSHNGRQAGRLSYADGSDDLSHPDQEVGRDDQVHQLLVVPQDECRADPAHRKGDGIPGGGADAGGRGGDQPQHSRR